MSAGHLKAFFGDNVSQSDAWKIFCVYVFFVFFFIQNIIISKAGSIP